MALCQDMSDEEHVNGEQAQRREGGRSAMSGKSFRLRVELRLVLTQLLYLALEAAAHLA